MERTTHWLVKLAPDFMQAFAKRYDLLGYVQKLQPAGRRMLSAHMALSERDVRAMLDLLKEQGLLELSPQGAKLTIDGERALCELDTFISILREGREEEKLLCRALGLEAVRIVQGNVDEDERVLSRLGQAAANYIIRTVRPGMTIAVTGGKTMAAVAKALPQAAIPMDVRVLPARGGVGGEVESQANTVASVMAKKLGGSYRPLYIPDIVDKRAMDALGSQPEIREVLQSLKKTDVLIHGIGCAQDMASRRELSESTQREILNKKAIAEAFGYYLNKQGEAVYAVSLVGVDSDTLSKIPLFIGVAGGARKAQAILAVSARKQPMVLVLDESASQEMLKLLGLK